MPITIITPRYTNEVTAQRLSEMNRRTDTDEALALLSPEAQAAARTNEAERTGHPITGIFRVATEGSQTRNGGVISQGSLAMAFKLDDGQMVQGAKVGDPVTYPDGTEAQIISGAGKANTHMALVGSRLSNGDEIINTPQHQMIFLERAGIERHEDFLPEVEA